MVHIKITRGLDIPINGKPEGEIKPLSFEGKKVSLNLTPFKSVQFKLMAQIGDRVKIGQPLAYDKTREGLFFASPAGGVVSSIRRGLKRRLLDIVIDVDEKEEWFDFSPLLPDKASKDALVDKFKEAGLFAFIKCRPFNLLVNPNRLPRDIFVKAVESAPFTPSAEMQVENHFEEFQIGLNALSKLTNGSCHLVYHENSKCQAFIDAKNVEKHTVSGPHPNSSHSLHIQRIKPITTPEDIVWTTDVLGVISIGHLLKTGHVFVDRIVSIAGPGIRPEKRGYFKVRQGVSIKDLASNNLVKGEARLISGDPLTGRKVTLEDYLGILNIVFCAIPESKKRDFLHFVGLGLKKFTASRAYFSNIFRKKKKFDFTTSLHGEKRAFIEPSLYDKVIPLNIPTMQLVKAVMAKDFELAEELGLLEVDSEDFALPTFVCPSKINMVQIIQEGLAKHASEVMEIS